MTTGENDLRRLCKELPITQDHIVTVPITQDHIVTVLSYPSKDPFKSITHTIIDVNPGVLGGRDLLRLWDEGSLALHEILLAPIMYRNMR